MPHRRPLRISISFRRSVAWGVAWIASVLLAAGVGWLVGRVGPRSSADVPDVPPIVEQTPRPAPVDALIARILQAESDGLIGPAAPAEIEDAPVEPPAAAPPSEPPTAPQAAPMPEPEAEPPPPVAAEPAESADPPELAAVVPPVQVSVLVRALRAGRLAERGDEQGAKADAEALLEEYPGYTDLIAALIDDGSDRIGAQLAALRVLQVAGHDSISRDVARELRRSYAGTEQVTESIRRWGILRPRITSVESTIDAGRYVVVHGAVENPDVVEIRRVRVRVEALDTAGNVIGTMEARTRPKVLDAGGMGAFTASFKSLDPSTVVRTRATVIEWESALHGAG